jgi:hypothetical protein
VASWAGRERNGPNPWTDKEFYELGADWLDFDRLWRQTVGYEPGIVLEIGCGAGRITRMLAGAFVIGQRCAGLSSRSADWNHKFMPGS